MKHFFRTALAVCLLFVVSNANAQTAKSLLNNVIQDSKDIKTDAKANRTALNTLSKAFFQIGNPNVAAYLATMSSLQSNIESLQDDITADIRAAAALNAAINPTNIVNWASMIEGREDFVQIESQTLATAIANNDRPAARTSVQLIRGYLGEQIQLANNIINEAKSLKAALNTFNVRIELVDNNGNLITGSTGLQGYYTQNVSTGQYIYPDRNEEFIGLPGGTYRFDSFDGYFDGTGSNTVTLSNSLVGSDGYIVVQLVYWSE